MTTAFKPEPLDEVLDAVDEALDQHEDVRDGPHGEPLPNWAMELRRRLRDSRAMASATTDGLVQALKICCAALSSMPEIDGRYTAEHRTAHAYALVTARAGVAVAEGRPFDPKGTELVVMLNSARDALEYLLPRVDLRRAGGREMRLAEAALMALTRMVGPGAIERKIARFAAAYVGEDVTPSDVAPYSHHD